MKFTVIQYSDFSDKNSLKEGMPARISGKFVQMKHKGDEYLLFSPKELSRYHADIVKRYCREKGIDGKYVEEAKRFDIDDPSWVILGGGKYELNREKKVLRLYDNSMAYGRFESQGLEEKILTEGSMTGYRVEIA